MATTPSTKTKPRKPSAVAQANERWRLAQVTLATVERRLLTATLASINQPSSETSRLLSAMIEMKTEAVTEERSAREAFAAIVNDRMSATVYPLNVRGLPK